MFIGVFIILLSISLFVYTRYFLNIDFGDEYDNFTYSWLTSLGVLPYRDFFTHHFPSLIFTGVPLEFISHSKATYRIFIMLVTFTFFSTFSFIFKGAWRYAFLLFMLFSSYGIASYGGFQYADGTFWSFLILTTFFAVVSKKGQPFGKWGSAVLGFIFAFVLFSSPMHVTALVSCFALHLIFQKRSTRVGSVSQNLTDLKYFLVAIFSTFLIFLMYLLATGSFGDFWFSTITYNDKYFYYRDHNPIVDVKIVDFYLHAFLHFKNHLAHLLTKEGSSFVIFLKSIKPIFTGQVEDIPVYIRIIYKDFFNNFFNYESIVSIFYIIGVLTLFLNKHRALAVFIFPFIILIRLRVPERIHEAPYYLLSYWLIAITLSFAFKNVLEKKKVLLNVTVLFFCSYLLVTFVVKSWYDFNQIAFNRFPKASEGAVGFIKKETAESEKILVISTESAEYYYDSERKPFGKFVNYFEWYNWAPQLREEWLGDISSNRMYLFFDKGYWNSTTNAQGNNSWLGETIELVKEKYYMSDVNFNEDTKIKKDYIFINKGPVN